MKDRHKNEFVWFEAFTRHIDGWNHLQDEYLGDKPFDKFLFVQEAESWEDFVGWLRGREGRWGFRGQSDSSWVLDPTIDRRLWITGEIPGLSFQQRAEVSPYETQMLFRFHQEAHQYRDHLPDETDTMSWLALMQHHGAPTRLLDWSLSPYVAAYFALEDRTQFGP